MQSCPGEQSFILKVKKNVKREKLIGDGRASLPASVAVSSGWVTPLGNEKNVKHVKVADRLWSIGQLLGKFRFPSCFSKKHTHQISWELGRWSGREEGLCERVLPLVTRLAQILLTIWIRRWLYLGLGAQARSISSLKAHIGGCLNSLAGPCLKNNKNKNFRRGRDVA